MNPKLDPDARRRIDTLSSIFSPRSNAIVGASDTVSKIVGIPVDFRRRASARQPPLYHAFRAGPTAASQRLLAHHDVPRE